MAGIFDFVSTFSESEDVSSTETMAAPLKPGSHSNSTVPSTVGSSVSQRYKIPAHRGITALENELKIAQLEAQIRELKTDESKCLGGKLPGQNLPFFLKKSKMEFLQRRFPRTTFKCTSDNAHDHPLAHTETMIAVAKAQRMIEAGSTVVDYYGSVSACTDFNAKQARSNNPKRAIAYIDLMSPKAYIRHRKIGDVVGPDGQIRYIHVSEGIEADLGASRSGLYIDRAIPGGDVTWFFKHSIYYLSDEQIQDCLNVEGSRGLAVIHRHVASSGQLFDGECTYAKVEGCVEQVNTLTGEGYVHRDMSWLWDSRSKVKYNTNGAFTWTFHMVTEETWIVEFVAVPVGLDERYTKQAACLGKNAAVHEMNTAAEVPTHFPHPSLADMPDATCLMVGGIPVVKFGDTCMPDCRVTSPELYEFLLASVVGKPRDADRLQDLFALARSHCLSTSEFPGKKNFGVRASDIAGHVFLAHVTGLSSETRMLRAMACHDVWAREHSALLDGVHVLANTGREGMVRSAVGLAKRVNQARKQGDTFDGILQAIDNSTR
jgi:hypothetical protein